MGEHTEVVTDSWQRPDIATTEASKRPRHKQRRRTPLLPKLAPSPVQNSRSTAILKPSSASSKSSVTSGQSQSCEEIPPHRAVVDVKGRLREIRRPRSQQQSSIMAMVYDSGVPLNPDPRALTWQRLEAMRLKKLGINPSKYSYSRHMTNVFRNPNVEADSATRLELSGSTTQSITEAVSVAEGLVNSQSTPQMASSCSLSNSVAPFATVGKPTCGYYFSDQTNNKKRKFGIPPSDLVKWRNHIAQQSS